VFALAGAGTSWFNAGVAAPSIAENTAATTLGNPDPTGVDTMNNTANPEHTAAAPAARCRTHSAPIPITNKIRSPTLGIVITHPSNHDGAHRQLRAN
jgi:hypothetical protein